MTDFKKQRWLFRMARKAGWSGKEPAILGSFEAEKAYRDAKEFLLLQVNPTIANMADTWFSGTCQDCGVWSNKWEQPTTEVFIPKMKCPECGVEQNIVTLKMHRQHRLTG